MPVLPESYDDLKDIMTRLYPVGGRCLMSLARTVQPCFFSRGDVIVPQDVVCEYIYFFRQGLQRVGLEKNGRADTVAFGGAGDVYFSIPTFFCGGVSTFELTALDECEGWCMTFSQYRALEKRYPELAFWMNNLLGIQMHAIELLYRRFLMTPPEQRLRDFYENYNKDTGLIVSQPLKKINRLIPLKYLAQYIGVTPQTLSKLRRRLLKDQPDSGGCSFPAAPKPDQEL